MQTLRIIALFLFLSSGTFAQELEKPEVGKPIPDFTLNKIFLYSKSSVSSQDFKDKWLFLDFWFTGCVSCIQSFPKVNEFYTEFKNDINWVLVGWNEAKNNADVYDFYDKIRERRKLSMPYAFDSVLFKQWQINSMPHIVIVDPSGYVRFITSGRDMSREKISDLLNCKSVSFAPKDVSSSQFNPVSKNENNVLYRSLLTKWDGEEQNAGVELDRWLTWPDTELEKGYSFAMVPLYALYNYAYFGAWQFSYEDSLYGTTYPYPVLEIADSANFNFDYNVNVGKGLFSYDLYVPSFKRTREAIMKIMQEDLKRGFNYTVKIEEREMPVWLLTASPEAIKKLKSKGGRKFTSPGSHAMGFTAKNWPREYLIGLISFYIREKFKEPFIDQTGLMTNFDLSLDADMTDILALQSALKPKGLFLNRGLRRMKVMVISDRDMWDSEGLHIFQ